MGRMGNWVLILTLHVAGPTGAAAIEHVPGFFSADACDKAAKAWIAIEGWDRPYRSALCVQTGWSVRNG